MGDFINFLGNNLADFWTYTGFANATGGHIAMIIIGLGFIYLAVAKEFEPMLLIPIGFGILIGNIPFNMDAGLKVGIYEEGSVLNILYQGVTSGWYPPLIFLGIGAMTDFSALISNPKLMLIGAAAQFGIFGAYMIALEMGFDPMQAGAIGIIGGADGPTAIFLSSKLAPNLMGAIAVSAYSYMALVPVIQPPIMRLLTTKHERVIRMKPPRAVSHTEKVIFPIIGLLLTCFLVPSGLPLLGMLFFGNLLKESGVTRRLANTACFFVGLGFAKYKYYLLNHLTAVLFFTSITYIVLLQWWDYDYAKYTFFNFFKFLMALNDPTVARPMLEGLLKEFYRICVGISGAVMILSFILLIFAKLPNVKLLNRLSVLGQYTLGIYVIQTVLLERIIKSVITFDASSFYYFNFLLAPAISLAVLICCIVLVKLFLRSKWTSFILLGK